MVGGGRMISDGISLSYLPGAKIGVLGHNGARKGTLLRIMAGVDNEFLGEARPAAELQNGYLENCRAPRRSWFAHLPA